MGRWCFFSNGFSYKFWFCVQDSGFQNITGVDENNEPIYSVLYEQDEHPFCSCNCDKPPKNPADMLRDGENLFCDEECKKNFTGGEPNEPLDMERLCHLWGFLTYCKENGLMFGDTIEQDGIDEETKAVWEDNGWMSPSQSVDFSLDVDKQELLTSIQKSGFAVPIWEDYDEDDKGTDSLWGDLSNDYDENTHDEERYADYVLSCLIYHMSLYDDSISGHYEC